MRCSSFVSKAQGRDRQGETQLLAIIVTESVSKGQQQLRTVAVPGAAVHAGERGWFQGGDRGGAQGGC